ncbi:hypothetical protein BGZ52_013406, partial [Haplosporangium bisporale]
ETQQERRQCLPTGMRTRSCFTVHRTSPSTRATHNRWSGAGSLATISWLLYSRRATMKNSSTWTVWDHGRI